jgi:hypothetical protein
MNGSILCFSIDATHEEARLARYINDAPKKEANCVAKAVDISGRLHIIIFAGANDITPGTELRYDYGGGDLPWRKKVSISFVTYLIKL